MDDKKITIKLFSENTQYSLPEAYDNDIVLSITTTVDELSNYINNVLELDTNKKWSFYINEQALTGSIENFLEHNSSYTSENILKIEYINRIEDTNNEHLGSTKDSIIQIFEYNNYVITFGDQSILSVFERNTTNGIPIIYIQAVECDVIKLCELSNGLYLGIASTGLIYIYNVKKCIDDNIETFKCKPLEFYLSVHNKITSFAINESFDYLAIGTEAGQIIIYKLNFNLIEYYEKNETELYNNSQYNTNSESLSETLVIKSDFDIIVDMVFNKNVDKRLFAIIAVSISGIIHQFDYLDGSTITKQNSGSPITSIALFNNILITGHIVGTVKYWDITLSEFKLIRIYNCSKQTITQIKAYANELSVVYFITVCNDKLVRLYELNKIDPINTFSNFNNTVEIKKNFGVYPFAVYKSKDRIYIGTNQNSLYSFNI